MQRRMLGRRWRQDTDGLAVTIDEVDERVGRERLTQRCVIGGTDRADLDPVDPPGRDRDLFLPAAERVWPAASPC